MTATKIRQSEFAATYRLLPGEIKALREKHLTEGDDFWSEGRAIYWTEEAAAKVGMYLIKPSNLTVMVNDTDFGSFVIPPETATVRVIKAARNPRWVYAVLDGERINVACGKHAKRIIGKEVSVQVSEHEGITIYTYNP